MPESRMPSMRRFEMPVVGILPEKITHPVQLMAAWFVMLVSLDSVLLVAATKIQHPAWAAGFLVVSSVVLALLVLLAVLLMLTRFRPHLQGPKEYAEWLRDERRLAGQEQKGLEVRELPGTEDAQAVQIKPEQLDPPMLAQNMGCTVEAVRLPGVEKLLAELRARGFRAKMFEYPQPDNEQPIYFDPSSHTAIWLGSRVPPRVALQVMKVALTTWPHLRYISLSTDSEQQPPDHVHDEVFLGGATSTAEEVYKLRPWLQDEILRLPDDMPAKSFHALVRSRYPSPK